MLIQYTNYRLHITSVIFYPQILQEIPILCSLCTSDSFPKVLLEILSLLMASVKTKQEEKNLVKLIQHLLQVDFMYILCESKNVFESDDYDDDDDITFISPSTPLFSEQLIPSPPIPPKKSYNYNRHGGTRNDKKIHFSSHF